MIHEQVSIGAWPLSGEVMVPDRACGLVVFAHGSGSSRHSPRNRFVAETLQRRGLATLLFDLLTDDEAADRANVFDIPLLAERLVEAVEWACRHTELAALPVGLFGASTGAAAALVAAAERPQQVRAVVSRGGRPDLAAGDLERVRAPTLLIVGGSDREVLELNRRAYRRLDCEKRLEVVPGATHLFEEAGALEQVADAAGAWFVQKLSASASGRAAT